MNFLTVLFRSNSSLESQDSWFWATSPWRPPQTLTMHGPWGHHPRATSCSRTTTLSSRGNRICGSNWIGPRWVAYVPLLLCCSPQMSLWSGAVWRKTDYAKGFLIRHTVVMSAAVLIRDVTLINRSSPCGGPVKWCRWADKELIFGECDKDGINWDY